MSRNGIVSYAYTECGLPNVRIIGLRVEDDAGESTIRIPHIRSLHRLISQKVVASKNRLTGAELRYLRSEMGLTPEEFGKRVHRQPSTVTRWERAETSLPREMEARIRILAYAELKLGVIDPQEAGRWHELPTIGKTGETPIEIDGRDPGNYRLVA